jgi:hypothetical protein
VSGTYSIVRRQKPPYGFYVENSVRSVCWIEFEAQANAVCHELNRLAEDNKRLREALEFVAKQSDSDADISRMSVAGTYRSWQENSFRAMAGYARAALEVGKP